MEGGEATIDPAATGNAPRGSAVGTAAASGTGGEGAAAAGAGGSGGQRRRPRNQEVQETVDELAQETKRVTLLEREEHQLKGEAHVSRLLFVFGVSDDRKLQSMIEQEFATWRDREGENITGVLLFLSQAAIHFLEGPTETIFRALELFHSFTQEVLPTPVATTQEGGPKQQRPSAPKEAAPVVAPRPALISPVRILYFTELHGVRTSVSWCAYPHAAKLQGGQQIVLEESNSHELVFSLYKKMLMLCMRVQSGNEDEVDSQRLKESYGRASELFPSLDEVLILLAKNGAEFFFSYPEFEKVFMKPFQLVLHSELLWPMPPALSY